MKITIEVDCTAAEARQFMGLPDLQPLQANVLAEIEKRLLAEMTRFSAENVLKSWLSLMPQSPDRMQDMLGPLFQAGFGTSKPEPRT